MPNVKRNAREEFRSKRLPKSRFFDLDECSSSHPLGLNHMLPSAATFASTCSSLGISKDSTIVVYDTHGVFSSPRALWTFKAFNHPSVVLLDGGLPRWEAEGYPAEEGEPEAADQASYQPSLEQEEAVRSYGQMVASDSAQEIILDARPNARFTGSAPEPRPGLSSGHMPNSISLPFSDLLSQPSETNPPYKTMLEPHKLREAFVQALGSEAELDKVLSGERKVVASCGSGMTAAVIWLGLQLIGADSAIYDESWTGYAMRKESKILKG